MSTSIASLCYYIYVQLTCRLCMESRLLSVGTLLFLVSVFWPACQEMGQSPKG